MLELHLDLESFIKNQPEVESGKKTWNPGNIDMFVVDIYFDEENKLNIKTVNLLDKIPENDFDYQKFIENFNKMNPSCQTFLEPFKKIVSDESSNGSNNDVKKLSKIFSKHYFFGRVSWICKQAIGNNSFGGNPGIGTQNLIYAYNAFTGSKDKEITTEDIDEDEENEKVKINKFTINNQEKTLIFSKNRIAVLSKTFLLSENKDMFAFNKKLIKEQGDINVFTSFVQFIKENQEEFDAKFFNSFVPEDKESMKYTKNALYIIKSPGIRKDEKIDLEKERNNIIEYFANIKKTQTENIPFDVCCKVCGKTNGSDGSKLKLSRNYDYVDIKNIDNRLYNFNLEETPFNPQTYKETPFDNSMYICKYCEDVVNANNLILSNNNFVFFKEEVKSGNTLINHGFEINGALKYDNIKVLKEISEIQNENSFGKIYKIVKPNKESEEYNFHFEMDYNSSLEITKVNQNFKDLNSLLKVMDSKKIIHYDFLKMYYNGIDKADLNSYFFRDQYHVFKDYWLHGKKFSDSNFILFIDRFLLNKITYNSKQDEFDFEQIEKTFKLNTKGELSVNKLGTLNEKLKTYKDKDFDLDQEEVVIIGGAILNYLEYKSKKESENKTFNYLQTLNFSKKKLKETVENKIALHGHAILQSQSKFSTLSAIFLEKMDSITLSKDRIKSLFLIGVFSKGKIILVKEDSNKENFESIEAIVSEKN